MRSSVVAVVGGVPPELLLELSLELSFRHNHHVIAAELPRLDVTMYMFLHDANLRHWGFIGIGGVLEG